MKKILLTGIRFYQRYLSAMKGGSTCKFYPTCSQYAIEAIEKYGAFKGGRLAVWRILRCNPFTMGGYDPSLKRLQLHIGGKDYGTKFTDCR